MSPISLTNILSSLSRTALLPILCEITPVLRVGIDIASYEMELKDADDEQLRSRLFSLLTDQKSSKRLFESLSSYEKDTLHTFIFHVGDGMLTYRQVSQGQNGQQSYKLRLGLTGLRRKGIVYTIRRQWGEEAYILPPEIESLLYVYFIPDVDHNPISNEDVKIDNYPHSLYYHFVSFLDQVRQAPQMSIPLTKKQTIHKKYVRSWEEELVSDELDVSAYTVAFELKEIYSSSIAILLDFFSKEGLLHWTKDQLCLDSNRVEYWFDQGRKKIKYLFHQFWYGFV